MSPIILIKKCGADEIQYCMVIDLRNRDNGEQQLSLLHAVMPRPLLNSD